ncbi:MAG: hypothetical protein AAFU64_18475, partial [Bacteroidota bacterium]
LRLLLGALLLSTTTSVLAGGGWPQPKGKSYWKLSQWWLVSDQHFTDQGLIDPNVTTGIFNTSLYAEYGFTDRLTGTLYFPFLSRTYMNNLVSSTTDEILVPGEALNSVGDTDIGIKYGLTPGKRVSLATSLVLGLPIGNPAGGTQMNLQTGDGEFNQLLQFDAGVPFSLGKLPAYANGYVGFNNRTNGFSDEFRFGAEVGAAFLEERLWIIGRAFGVESFQNGQTAADFTGTSIFANNTEFFSLSVEANCYVTERVGVSANYTGAVSGSIIFAAPSYSVGVFLDLTK